MAKRIKKVSINSLEKIAKESTSPVVTKQWFDNEIVITPTLSLSGMLGFVADVVASCFDEQGDYMPEVLDFAVGSCILERYANFSLPQNLETRYYLIYNTDAVDIVFEHINKKQFEDMRRAIKSKIEYLCNTNSNYIRTGFEKILNGLGTIQEKADDVFDGVNSNDVQRLMTALGHDDNLTADKIVEAYLGQTTMPEVQEE